MSRGFTLIEVIVAITVGAIAVLMAGQTFNAALNVSERLQSQSEALATDLSGRLTLARAFGNLTLGSGDSLDFDGGPSRVAFGAFSLSADRSVRRVVANVRTGWLVMSQGDEHLRLMRADRVSIDYLLEEGSESRWIWRWHSTVAAPVAVRLRLRRDSIRTDTLLFIVGRRG